MDEAEEHDHEESSSDEERPETPMLDPSTNTNPLEADESRGTVKVGGLQGGKKEKSSDVSKHTFYIENSQMKLKLYAKNEVCRLSWAFYTSSSVSASNS